MSDILNPLGGRYLGPSGPVTTTSVLGTVADPPRGLRQVDPGTIIKGIVLGRESDGLTAIATDKGTVRVAANVPLPAGAQVTLEVRPAGDRLQVLILANEVVSRAQAQGAPPQQPHQGPAPAAGPGAQPTPAPSTEARPNQGGAPATPPPVRADAPSIEFVGSTLRAVVVQAPPPPGTAVPLPQQPVPPPSTGTVPAPTGTVPTTSLPPPAGGSAQPSPEPQGGAAPAPTNATPPLVTATTGLPGAVTNVATLQAALIAANLEKKEKPIGSAPSTASSTALGAPLPSGAHALQLETLYPAEAIEEHTAGSPASPLVPPESTLSAETRQRILALFAAAGLTAEVEGVTGATTEPSANGLGKVMAAAAAAPLPVGAEIKLRVLAVQMQAGQQVAIDPIALDPHDAQGQIIFGRVVSITPAGHAVIHTPVGDIMLQNRSSLTVGAQLALAIDVLETAAPPLPATPIVQTPQQALLTLSKGWPTLADFVAILQGAATDSTRATVDPDLARQSLEMLPHVGNKLGAGLLNAMTALRAGDLGKLLGPLFAAKGGPAEREEQVRRLKGEFTQLSALAQDRPDVDWRALFLPVIDDQGRVTQINLFYRQGKKKSGESGDKGSGTRFVVEADFTRLGPFQLDGLMRPQRFDLMVRSRLRLADRMRREIEAIYEEARGLTGFAGSIAFQTVDAFPVVPLDELKRGQPTYTV
ncbi:hypothetical protein [Dongia sp.]|uniref:hypothetical protein n=1 Tax=Dongia sp. TaxID=1977262 RepID=UPI0035B0B45A